MTQTTKDNFLSPNVRHSLRKANESVHSVATTVVEGSERPEKMSESNPCKHRRIYQNEKEFRFKPVGVDDMPSSGGHQSTLSDVSNTIHIDMDDSEKPTHPSVSESPANPPKKQSPVQSLVQRIKLLSHKAMATTKHQFQHSDNRYAFQMSVGFLFASLFVVIPAITKVTPNGFWVGVSVVTVLDNTVGGFLTLSIQRMIGTIIGGGLSMVVMTITRAIFPDWNWKAVLVLCFFMFCQVFFIARIKLKPNMSYAGGIGLLTTVIILLSGYPDLIKDKLSASARLGFWRTFDLVIGILIAMLVSLCIFPHKARYTMRINLGKALEEAANLYERTTVYCFDLDHSTDNLTDALKRAASVKRPHNEPIQGERPGETPLVTEPLNGTSPPVLLKDVGRMDSAPLSEQLKVWNDELVSDLCNKAFGVLTRLQAESMRLRNVSKEYYLKMPLLLLTHSGRERCRHYRRRTKQYSCAIDATKSIVWPLVSFRLLLPLFQSSVLSPLPGMSQTQSGSIIHARTVPTRATVKAFEDSISVMRQLSSMLKDTSCGLSEQKHWTAIQDTVSKGSAHVQHELTQTIRMGMHSKSVDGLRLLSYYGFLVRCTMIWQGLETIVNELGPGPRRDDDDFQLPPSYPPSAAEQMHAQG